MVDVFFVQFIDGVDVPVIIQRRGLLSVLGKVVDMPVASKNRCLWFTVQKTVEFPQHVDVCWRSSSTLWTSLCSCRDVVCSPGQRRLHARCVQRHVLGVTVQITVEVPPLHVEVCWCSSSTVVDVPVLMQGRVTGPSCCNDRVFGPDSAEHCLEVYRCSSSSQRQGSQCKLYRRLEIPWCSSRKVSTRPLVCKRQGYGSDSAEKLWFCSWILLTRWSMSLLLQFIGCGRPCEYAVTQDVRRDAFCVVFGLLWIFFGALDGTQFLLCVVEGRWLTPGVELPGVGPSGRAN